MPSANLIASCQRLMVVGLFLYFIDLIESTQIRRESRNLAVQIWCFVAFALVLATRSYAACSEDHIRDLDRRGKTVSEIAAQCGMGRREVSEILHPTSEPDPSEKPEPPHRRRYVEEGLPRGTQTNACGCWGWVALGAVRPNPSCASGVEVVVPCNVGCPMGGGAWATACQ